jgi:hypothetical protein
MREALGQIGWRFLRHTIDSQFDSHGAVYQRTLTDAMEEQIPNLSRIRTPADCYEWRTLGLLISGFPVRVRGAHRTTYGSWTRSNSHILCLAPAHGVGIGKQLAALRRPTLAPHIPYRRAHSFTPVPRIGTSAPQPLAMTCQAWAHCRRGLTSRQSRGVKESCWYVRRTTNV